MRQIAFGRYTLHHRLARGGMAELFLAHSAGSGGTEELVVIKLLLDRYAEDEAFLSMFRDEARIASTLHHPNIGRVVDVGEVEGQSYIAMEYLHGRDLTTILQRSLRQGGPLPLSFAVPVAVHVCAALHHAHQARDEAGRPLQIVHRDVSPSNVMITFGGQVKLVDFGIAKAANRCSRTMPGMLKGKARYMSPEQITGQDLDHRSDIFTLGATLWEATCGRHLFAQPEEMLVFEAVAKGWVTRPSEVIAAYPPELERILLRALSLSAADRQPTALELQRDLQAFTAASGIQIRDVSLSRTMQQLFPQELAAWQQALAGRKTLLQHLLAAADASEHAHDLQQVLSRTDQRPTQLDGDRGRRQEPISAEKTSATGPPTNAYQARKTLIYGQEPTAGTPGAPPAPAAAPAGSQHRSAAGLDRSESKHYRLVEQGSLAIGPDGDVLTAETLSSVDDGRPTILPGGSAAAEDRAPHAAEPSDTAAPGDFDCQVVTGDWALQATSKGENRAGTHPYFGLLREVALTFRPVDPEEGYSPVRARRRLVIRLVLGGLLLALLLVLGLVFALRDQPAPSTPPVQPAASVSAPTPAAGAGDLLQVESDPGGATVFDATSGRELGQTPLQLDLQGQPQRQLILRREGYHSESLTLRRAERVPRVTLRSQVAAAAPVPVGPAKARPQGNQRRPNKPRFQPKPAEDNLIDPFK